MLTTVVSDGNMMLGRMISGVLAMSLDHPLLLCAILSALAGAACAVLVDMVGAGLPAAPRPTLARTVRPVRIWRA